MGCVTGSGQVYRMEAGSVRATKDSWMETLDPPGGSC